MRVYVYVYVYLYVCVNVNVDEHVYVCICKCICTCLCTYKCECVRVPPEKVSDECWYLLMHVRRCIGLPACVHHVMHVT